MPKTEWPQNLTKFSAQQNATLKRSVALVIGITSFESMTREDATAYAASLAESLTELRQKNTPIIWGVIGNGGNKLVIPPSAVATGPQDFKLLMDMEFDETGGNGTNRDIHLDFLRNFGPRDNEVLYRKPTKDTLLHPNDGKTFGTAYQKELLVQAGVKTESQRAPTDPPNMRYIHDDQIDSEFIKFFNDQTLADFLSQRNTNNILVMGAIANFCVTETSVSSALKGYDTTIATDRVLGWDRPLTTFAERQAANMVWQNTQSSTYHADRVRNKIAYIAADPVRSLTSQQISQINNIHLLKFDDYMLGLRMENSQQQHARHSEPDVTTTFYRFLEILDKTNPAGAYTSSKPVQDPNSLTTTTTPKPV